MRLIERTHYLSKLMRAKDTPDIKIITGIRRCGKSKLMEAFISLLKKQDSKANIIHINFNLLEYEKIAEYHALHEYAESHQRPDKNNYLLIDEVQMCPFFEKAINSLHASGKYDIYLTGSNAFLMGSDLVTLFTGRTFSIEVFPFSFAEYLQYFQRNDICDAFSSYMKEGGMPGSYLYSTPEEKYRYISGEVFDSLIVRDILHKHKIRKQDILYRLTDHLMDNAGCLVSSRKIADTLVSQKSKTNGNTIGAYIDYLCRAFAFYKVRRYDIRGKRYLSSEDKYYLADHSFKYARLGTRNMDYGHIIENIAAMELLRRGYEIYAGILYKKEIDFVAIKRDEKIYVQVSDDISRPETFAREIAPLLAVRDAYPKIILARTRNEAYQYEGIKIYDISAWAGNRISETQIK